MTHLQTLLTTLSLLLLVACGGSEREREAAGVAGVAAALEVVRVAQGQNPDLGGDVPATCCVRCDECHFPCGGECVALGTLCAMPAGCACSGGPPRAVRPDGEPASTPSCPTAPVTIGLEP